MSKARRARHSGHRRADSGTRSEAPRKSSVALRLLMAGAVVLAVAGTTAVGLMTRGQGRPDGPAVADSTPGASVGTASASPTVRPRGPVMRKSTPVAIRIARIRVRSRVFPLALRSDGTIALPSTSRVQSAGWYEHSPTPGEVGPSILLGYADSLDHKHRPVFGDLARLRRGDLIQVNRADGLAAVFRISHVAQYPVTRFPTNEVYSATNYAALRLITVALPGTTPPPHARNIVVYANLLKTAPAS